MPGAKNYKCGECGDSIGKSHGSIQCKLCKLWFHPGCVGVLDKHLTMYKEMQGNFFFTCNSCSLSPPYDGSPHNDFKKYFDQLTTTLRNDNNDFKNTMMQLLSEFKSEISSCVKGLKKDITDCRNLVEHIETSTSSKICALENEVNALHRRLNRGDVIVSGLPSGLNNLSSTVVTLSKHYNIGVSTNDINQVLYINDNKQVLIKFNNIDLRDALMRAYFKSRELKVKHIIGGDIDKRVFLNDHYSPAASKINVLCRKMLHLKIITKYKIINKDVPRAAITFKDGKQLECDLAECGRYLAKDSRL